MAAVTICSDHGAPQNKVFHCFHYFPICHEVEMLLLNHKKALGFLASGGEEFNPGPETRLDHQELLYSKVLLKCKGDRESFWQASEGGRKSTPLLVLAMELYTLQLVITVNQKNVWSSKDLTRPTPIIYTLR